MLIHNCLYCRNRNPLVRHRLINGSCHMGIFQFTLLLLLHSHSVGKAFAPLHISCPARGNRTEGKNGCRCQNPKPFPRHSSPCSSFCCSFLCRSCRRVLFYRSKGFIGLLPDFIRNLYLFPEFLYHLLFFHAHINFLLSAFG